ncbi:hypothetical protein [Streptomyces sp. CdTB01]|nr:hypothetical protein [Streptomyces sp. CdTB01]
MTDQVQEIVTRLPATESVTAVWDTAEDNRLLWERGIEPVIA